MPGYDGTGPRGLGPMTGRGRGYCIMPLEDTSNNMGKKIPSMEVSYIKPKRYNLPGKRVDWSIRRIPNPLFMTTGFLRARWPNR